jgi:Tol biopolymer transport system component
MPFSHAVLLAFLLLVLAAARLGAEEIRDYYAEPGINPFKETLNQDLNEHIDPFSGTLQHRYIDMLVPGNGGLDIRVTRVYTSQQDQLGVRTVTGAGWTMHFGRVVVPTAHRNKLCTQDTYSVRTLDNPSIEFPDGGRELLVLDAVHGQYLITKSGWRAKCNNADDGLIVTSPTGIVYTMDALNTLNNNWSWYTTRIEDRHGNAVDIAYDTNAWNFIYITRVTASDGRAVRLSYEDQEGLHIRLSTITSNDQVWSYHYEPIDTPDGGNYYHLVEVVRPDGMTWKYRYYRFNPALEAVGDYSLESVTYPYGANIVYTYRTVDFTPNDGDYDPTTCIATKRVAASLGGTVIHAAGASVPEGTWAFEYEPNSPDLFPIQGGSGWVSGLDKTTVRMPSGRRVYFHYGYSYTGRGVTGLLWATGLLYKQELWADCLSVHCVGGPSGVVDQVYNAWEPRLISHEDFWHGRTEFEADTYAPMLVRRVHNRDNVGYETRYERFDDFGNAQRVVDRASVYGEADKLTTLSYHIDRETWILHQVEDETVQIGDGSVGAPSSQVISYINRTFDEHADLVAEDKNGVMTSYTYTPHGDLASVTDARGNTITYSDYHRGIARLERGPEGLTLSRTVNDTGTIASQTNGRGYTRDFTYDAMNRVTGITYPIHAPVSIVWDTSGKSLRRASYEEHVTLDGFGRVVNVTRSDTERGLGISRSARYDVLGNKVFESYPNSDMGISYAYDLLQRLATVQHPDGALRSYSYGGTETSETDERGNITRYRYRSYGAPDKDKVLIEVDEPHNIHTRLDYNPLNMLIRIFQGEKRPTDGSIVGYERTLDYDSRYFLTSVNDPETGETRYGRDEVGNMVMREVVGAEVTTYNYDGLNRLVSIDSPGNTPDVTRSYDTNGNILRLMSNVATIDYRYDENDKPSEQVLTISDASYVLGYRYNELDFLTRLIYPSGRTVDYLPDAFGRPTQAAPFVGAVEHHPSGQLARIVYANGTVSDIALDERQWVSEILHHGRAELGYRYDPLGNVLGISDLMHADEERTFEYDGLNRLTGAQGRWGQGSFAYSAFGDIGRMELGPDEDVFSYDGLRLYTVRHNGIMRRYTHDVYGNIRSQAEYDAGGGLVKEQEYAYDDAGYLREVLVTDVGGGTQRYARYRFGYDGEGQQVTRVGPGGGLTRLVHSFGQLIGEYGGTPVYGKEYVYLGSQLVASVKTNETPKADAGPDRIVDSGQEVTLDAAASSDPDGSIRSYAWGQTAGRAVVLSDSASVSTRFEAPVVTAEERLSFRLRVTDDVGESGADQIDVLVRPAPNDAPRADAGRDWTVPGGAVVTLDGTGSSDDDGIAGYAWRQIGGTAVGLNYRGPAIRTFTAHRPVRDEALSFALTVTDGRGATGVDDVVVTVEGNRAPVADAGVVQFVPGGATVTLDGTGSSDPDGSIARRVWRQTAGIPVVLQEPGTASPRFQAPRPVGEEVLSFTLTVTDDIGAAGTAAVNVVVTGNRPIAEAGRDQIVISGAPVTLDGTGSRDDGGRIARYAWRQDTGTGVILSGPDTVTPGFTAPIGPATETLRFTLAVTDNEGQTAADAVDVHVLGFAVRDASTTTRVSVSNDGTEGHGMSRRAVISGDGRYVAFDSVAGDLVTGDTNDTRDVFLHDRWTEKTTRISVASSAGQGNGASEDPRLSANGRYVSFRSYASNLVIGDTNDLQDVFVHDLETGETTRVSVASDGREAWGFAHAISSDGRYVAFDSASPSLVAGDTNNAFDIFVRDRQARVTTRVSVTSDGRESEYGRASLAPVISADGRHVAFHSNGLHPTRPGVVNPYGWNVMVHDRGTHQTTRASELVDPALEIYTGSYANGFSVNPDISADGRYVTFESTSRYLVSGDDDESLEIFIRDRSTNTTTVVDGVAEISPAAAISGNGRMVAFAAYHNEGVAQVFVHDREHGDTAIVSLAASGTVGNADSTWPDLSGDGRYVVFVSEATNLVAGDTNGVADVFVRDRLVAPANTPPIADAGDDAAVSAGELVILDARGSRDPDGRITAYFWEQTAGTPVGLSDANDASPSFTAFASPTAEDLLFRLSVVDDGGAGATDTVIVHVEPEGGASDTRSPLTRFRRKLTLSEGVPSYIVTLTPDEPADVYVRVRGVGRIVSGAQPNGAWQRYNGPFTVKMVRPGRARVMFYSVDRAGNIEELKRRRLRRRR